MSRYERGRIFLSREESQNRSDWQHTATSLIVLRTLFLFVCPSKIAWIIPTRIKEKLLGKSTYSFLNLDNLPPPPLSVSLSFFLSFTVFVYLLDEEFYVVSKGKVSGKKHRYGLLGQRGCGILFATGRATPSLTTNEIIVVSNSARGNCQEKFIVATFEKNDAPCQTLTRKTTA